MIVAFSALALCGGLGLFACAQDGADLGNGSDPSTEPDAAATVDSAPTNPQGSGTHPAVDSAVPPPVDSGDPLDTGADTEPPPAPDAAPLPNGDCDTSNTVSALYYAYQYGKAKNPPACPCNPGYCCYNMPLIPPACIK